MDRIFSIYRKRNQVVDLLAYKKDPTHTGFRVKWATNFDVAPTLMFEAPVATGFLDRNVPRNSVDSQPTNHTRMVFDPTTYSIPTERSFWLQVVPMVGAVEQTPSPMTLVILDRRAAGNYTQFIHGTATTTVQQLDFYTIEDIRLTNEDTTNILRVGSEDGGATMAVLPQSNLYLPKSGAFGSLYVSSSAATVEFSAAINLAIQV